MNAEATIYQTSSARHLRLGGNIGKYVVDRYPSGELKISLKDDAHPGGVFIVGSVLPEAESLLELMILADALKERTSNVTVIIPKNVYVAATHGLFSGDAIKNLEKSNIKKIIVTNTLPLSVSSGKIRVVKIEPLIEGLIQEAQILVFL